MFYSIIMQYCHVRLQLLLPSSERRVLYVFYSTFEVRQGQTAVLSFFSFGSEFYGCCTDKSVK